jgi:predicted amidohydrolase YtcJ
MARTIVTGADVLTFDRALPRTDSFAFEDGRIVEVPAAGPRQGAEVLDLGGRTVLPGFTDSHIHFAGFSLSLDRIDLGGVRHLEEALRRVGERAGRPGEWILGRGFVIGGFEGIRFPTRDDLDRAAPDNPVAISSFDGHALWVNSRALEAAGIGPDTPDPPGGEIERDAGGVPTGILKENAADALSERIPKPDAEALSRIMEKGQARLHALGLTAIHNIEKDLAFRALQDLKARGKLRLRVCHFLQAAELDAARDEGRKGGHGDAWLRLLGVKAYADGALNVQTAWMLEPYGPERTRGIRVNPPETLAGIRDRGLELGMPLIVHAIGDAAVRMTVDVLAEAPAAGAAASHRIEHAQHVDPRDIPRMAAGGLSASVQPVHLCYDLDPIERHLGDRGRWAYPLASLRKAGVPLLFGSDAPIAPPNPFWGLHAAVNRQRLDGTPGEGWVPSERMELGDALSSAIHSPAVYAGEGDRRGAIAAGRVADFVVVDRAPDRVPPAEIKDIAVLRTVVGGETVFEAP